MPELFPTLPPWLATLLGLLMIPAIGAAAGVFMALSWPVVVKFMRRPESEQNWQQLRREHGFWKAYLITLGKGALYGAGIFCIFAVVFWIQQCMNGD